MNCHLTLVANDLMLCSLPLICEIRAAKAILSALLKIVPSEQLCTFYRFNIELPRVVDICMIITLKYVWYGNNEMHLTFFCC